MIVGRCWVKMLRRQIFEVVIFYFTYRTFVSYIHVPTSSLSHHTLREKSDLWWNIFHMGAVVGLESDNFSCKRHLWSTGHHGLACDRLPFSSRHGTVIIGVRRRRPRLWQMCEGFFDSTPRRASVIVRQKLKKREAASGARGHASSLPSTPESKTRRKPFNPLLCNSLSSY